MMTLIVDRPPVSLDLDAASPHQYGRHKQQRPVCDLHVKYIRMVSGSCSVGDAVYIDCKINDQL